MPNPQATPQPADDSWARLRTALEAVVRETAGSGGGGPLNQEELRRMVTEAVGAVLLEGNVLEKLVKRTLKAQQGSAEISADSLPREAIQQLCLETLRSFSLQTIGPLMKKELKAIVQKRLLEFANNEEFKDVLDARFRAMEQYIRTDVVPSSVKRVLETETEGA